MANYRYITAERQRCSSPHKENRHSAAERQFSDSCRKCDTCVKLRTYNRENGHKSSRRNCRNSCISFRSGLPKSSRLIFASIFIIFFTQNCHLTYAAVTKVPEFLDMESAIKASECAVREQIVDVRKEHPTLPTEANFLPSCVALKRCSGCCQSEEMHCVPTSVYTTRIQIAQTIMFPSFSYEELTLEFTHHASCRCKSMDDTSPVCVQNACQETETWNPEACACVTILDVECLPRPCDNGQRWSDESCQCESQCQTQPCSPREHWNSESCSCATCPINKTCLFGQVWDDLECACVSKCPAQNCPAHQIWNPGTCKCQCRPCHPKRLYHTRFNQDKQTCQCACKKERRGRAACETRGAEFSTKTCSCEHPNASRRRRGR